MSDRQILIILLKQLAWIIDESETLSHETVVLMLKDYVAGCHQRIAEADKAPKPSAEARE